MGASNEPVLLVGFEGGVADAAGDLPLGEDCLATRIRRGHWHAQATALLLFFLASPPVISGWRQAMSLP
jgi:hypothetical protein